jgi:hypothetical protein
VDALRVVDEYDERRRFNAHLGDIVVFHPFSPIERRFVTSDKPLEKPVHNSCGNAFLSFRDHPIDLFKDLGDPLAADS